MDEGFHPPIGWISSRSDFIPLCGISPAQRVDFICQRQIIAIRRADTPNDARYRKRYTHAMKSVCNG